MVRPLACFVLVLAALAVPATAVGARSEDPALWATINVCDSARSPNMVGVRVSMPGNGSAQRMYARLRLQYYSHLRRGWQPVSGAVSPRLLLGSARRDRQTGYTFAITPPSGGGAFLIRGSARLEWRRKSYRTKRVRVRRGGRTVVRRKRVFRRWVGARRTTVVTRRDRQGVQGGEGISLASCTVR